MKKSVKLLSLFAMLAGFSTVAAAEGVFVGGNLELQNSKTKNTLCDNDDEGWDCSLKDTRMGLGLKAGYDFNQFRVYGAYQYNPKAKKRYTSPSGTEYEATWKNHNLTVGADYTPSFTDNFKGLVGGYMGYSRLTLTDNKVGYDDGSASPNGFVYGMRLGGIYSFNEHNELEFGVKAEQAKYKKVEDERWYFKEKNTNYGAFVGYNYKF